MNKCKMCQQSFRRPKKRLAIGARTNCSNDNASEAEYLDVCPYCDSVYFREMDDSREMLSYE